MKISDSTLSLHSTHEAVSREVVRENLQVWREGGEPERLEIEGKGVGRLRQRAMALLQRPPELPPKAPEIQTSKVVLEKDQAMDDLHQLEVSLLKLLVERIPDIASRWPHLARSRLPIQRAGRRIRRTLLRPLRSEKAGA
ncbi:MAG: hypothetical protein P8166_06185 [Candidatus Thiodiazotropha sp.]